jgi:hypothetical protein
MAPLTPATPPGAPPITRTFAARDDLVEWTRKLNSTPPPGAASDAPATNTDRLVRRSSPPPSVLEADEPVTRAMPRSKPPVSGSGGSKQPRAWALMGAGVAAVGALIFVALRGGAPAVAPGTPVAATSLSVAVTSAPLPATPPVLSATVVAEPVPVPAPSASEQAKSHAGIARPSLSTSASSASADVASAQLRLTADPQASVTVVGAHVAQTRSTPVASLALPAGSYTVTFRSPTFGDPVATRVDLSAGAFRSVHADFRAAVPTVVVR